MPEQEPSLAPRSDGLPPYDDEAAMRILNAMNDPDWEDKRMSDSAATASTTPESPFDHAWFVARGLSMLTLEPGVEYTLVRNRDSSDAGWSLCYFADPSDASRYVTRVKAAFDAGTLGEPHFHPQPGVLDLMVYTVTRRA